MKTLQKLRHKLIKLLVGKTPVVMNSEIVNGHLQLKPNGLYKDVHFS